MKVSSVMQTIPASSIPVVILAGGYGSRLDEYTDKIPKPLVRVGELPIIVHIMRSWHNAGHREFIIAAGYRYEVLEFYLLSRSWADILPDSKISVIDTGLDTQSGGRLLKLAPQLSSKVFGMSYGDVLTSLPLEALLEDYCIHSTISTMLVSHPVSRFGEVIFNENQVVTEFSENPIEDKWINGGYFIFSDRVFEHIHSLDDDVAKNVLPSLVSSENLRVVASKEWWHSMDTPKDVTDLNNLWKAGKAPWIK